VQLHANERKDVPEVKAGEIAAIVGPKAPSPAIRCVTRRSRSFLRRSPSGAVIRVAIEPKTKTRPGQDGIALSKLMTKIPRSASNSDAETGQTIIAGMGELHLESSWIV